MSINEIFLRYDRAAWIFSLVSGCAYSVLSFIILFVADKIRVFVQAKKRIKNLNVYCWIGRDQSNYPCKLYIQFRNWTNRTFLITIEGYKLPAGIQADKNATRDSSTGLLEIKFIENAPQKNSSSEKTLNIDAIIRHGEDKTVWVPLSPAQDQKVLEEALSRGKIGKIKAEILWFDEKPIYRKYCPKIRR